MSTLDSAVKTILVLQCLAQANSLTRTKIISETQCRGCNMVMSVEIIEYIECMGRYVREQDVLREGTGKMPSDMEE